MSDTAFIKRILGQSVLGYNFTDGYVETVFLSVCLMSDGSTKTQYDGSRYRRDGFIEDHPYYDVCPHIDRLQASIPAL
jgi:hypothetical protein